MKLSILMLLTSSKLLVAKENDDMEVLRHSCTKGGRSVEKNNQIVNSSFNAHTHGNREVFHNNKTAAGKEEEIISSSRPLLRMLWGR